MEIRVDLSDVHVSMTIAQWESLLYGGWGFLHPDEDSIAVFDLIDTMYERAKNRPAE